MPVQEQNIKSSSIINLVRFFTRQRKSHILVFSYLLLFIIGVLDYITGPEIGFSIFYVAPVIMVALSISRKQGYIISSASGMVSFAADLMAKHTYSHPLIPWWNASVRFLFFAVITSFASALKTMYENEENLARTDFLTGTANRRLLFETAETMFFKKNANDAPLTAVYVDLDNFKKINDSLGHATGDSILQIVGETIKQNLRKMDIVARVGGDEFIILLPGTDSKGSKQVTYKIKERIIEQLREKKWPLTVTMGAATFLRPPASIDDIISKADDLMYEAKDAGKNTIKFRTWND